MSKQTDSKQEDRKLKGLFLKKKDGVELHELQFKINKDEVVGSFGDGSTLDEQMKEQIEKLKQEIEKIDSIKKIDMHKIIIQEPYQHHVSMKPKEPLVIDVENLSQISYDDEPHHVTEVSNMVDPPMGVSQWREHGIKYHYDEYFNIKWPKE